MSLFPFISVSDEVLEGLVNETVEELPLYKEIAWDYKSNFPITKNGEFVMVQGKEAVKVWVYKALLTPRFTHAIYSNNYGSELLELIGKAYTPSLTKAEAKRYIEEALSINPYILSSNVTDVSFKNDLLSARVEINTIYGKSEVII